MLLLYKEILRLELLTKNADLVNIHIVDLMHTEVFHHLMVVGLVILCGGGMSSSMHVDNRKKKISEFLVKVQRKG